MTIPTQGEKHVLARGGPFADTPRSGGLSHLRSGSVWVAGGDPGSGSTFGTLLVPPQESDDATM